MEHAKPTLVYAHRGASREAAENTRSAFERALAGPIDGIETDVQLTRDEVAVLWHDRFLEKLGLAGKRIDDFDYAELRALNFAGHFPGFSGREEIMRLRDFLDAYRSRSHLLLEIKNRKWEPRERHEIKMRQTLDMIGDHGGTLLASSFNLDSLIYAHQYRPGFPLVYNIEPEQELADIQRVVVGHPFLHGLCLPIETLSEATVTLLRSHGKNVAVYTCNSDEEIGKALQLGVDILISDLPQKALAMRDLYRQNRRHDAGAGTFRVI